MLILQVAAGGLLGNWQDLMNCFLRYSAVPEVNVEGWNETLAILKGHGEDLARILNGSDVTPDGRLQDRVIPAVDLNLGKLQMNESAQLLLSDGVGG
jgi:hypothetical protein